VPERIIYAKRYVFTLVKIENYCNSNECRFGLVWENIDGLKYYEEVHELHNKKGDTMIALVR
jgi:hypothetical protein